MDGQTASRSSLPRLLLKCSQATTEQVVRSTRDLTAATVLQLALRLLFLLASPGIVKSSLHQPLANIRGAMAARHGPLGHAVACHRSDEQSIRPGQSMDGVNYVIICM
jgi:hypothetical protein